MSQMKPSDNIHGSGVDNLIKPRILVISALQEAIEQMRGTLPHARDYFDESAFNRDRAIYRQRIEDLQILIDDLTAEGQRIQRTFADA